MRTKGVLGICLPGIGLMAPVLLPALRLPLPAGMDPVCRLHKGAGIGAALAAVVFCGPRAWVMRCTHMHAARGAGTANRSPCVKTC